MPPHHPSVRRVAVRLGGLAAVSAAVAAGLPACHGIEMFTYYGDGSRIGLPSLEVPIEAYRGIPLRSDRLRARRAAQRRSASATQPGTVALPDGMTVRVMPGAPAAAAPAAGPANMADRPWAARGAHPVAPDPDALFPLQSDDGGVSGTATH